MGESNRLQLGDEAPDFATATLDGTTVELAELRGTPVWLAFFRYAACPLCNFRLHELLSVWSSTFAARDFVMLAVFQSPQRKLEGLVKRHDPPFQIVSDPKLDLYAKYRLESSLRGMMGKDVRRAAAGASKAKIPLFGMWDGPVGRLPADFLVDRHGTIRNAFYGENVAQHIPFEEVTTFLDAHSG